jgi:hypothetical protein
MNSNFECNGMKVKVVSRVYMWERQGAVRANVANTNSDTGRVFPNGGQRLPREDGKGAFWSGDWRLGMAEERVAMAEKRLAAAERRVRELEK